MSKIVLVLALCLACISPALAQIEAPLRLQQTIPLPGVVGGFDHFAINESGGIVADSAGKRGGRKCVVRSGFLETVQSAIDPVFIQ